MSNRNIVLNIPHSSISGIFDAEVGKWQRNPHFINECVNRWTDWWTDMLFCVRMENVDSVVFPYSRFVCDVERLKGDPLESIGQGIIYTNFNRYKRGKIDEETNNELISLWERHQTKLSSFLNENSVLIDCHSFPGDMADVDICIGFNDDWSYDEKLVAEIIKIFKTNGYSIGINNPYSNSITPTTEARYVSLMIEVNKRVYMNEKLLLLNRNHRQWMRWYGCLKRVYEHILVS
ncbi:MAG: N-formylglutamate amidohydrolase [Muribaculum sp.]|nr:N-formylglutamate amidohydrolase [Muribaculum sp.]